MVGPGAAPLLRVVAPRPAGRAELAFGALLGFVLVVYANPGNWIKGMDNVGFAKVAAAVSLAALFGSWLLYNRPLRLGGSIGLCLCALFAWIGLSASWSFYPAMTRSTFSDGLKYLAMFFVVANVVDSEARFARLTAWLAWVTCIPALGCINAYLHGEHLVEGDRAAWIGIFANPNDLAYHLVVGIALALAAREAEQRRVLRASYLGVLALFAVTVLLTKSRGGMLASSSVLLLWGLRSMRRARALFGVALTIGCVLSLGPRGAFRARNESSIAFGEDVSAKGRFDAWRTGMSIAAERPLTGVGAGAFQVAWPTFAPGDAGPARTEHNTLVQLIAELGLPGLALFLVALGTAILGVTRRSRASLDAHLRGVQVGLAGFAVCSVTGGLALSWPLYLLLGLAVAAERLRARRPVPFKGAR
jgi:probable O-glycosylation ligase (exosortase A-associated)